MKPQLYATSFNANLDSTNWISTDNSLLCCYLVVSSSGHDGRVFSTTICIGVCYTLNSLQPKFIVEHDDSSFVVARNTAGQFTLSDSYR